MRTLIKFAADSYTSSQLPLPPSTTSNVPLDDHVRILITLGSIASTVLFIAVFMVIMICCCRGRSSPNNSPTSPEPPSYFMVVELTPFVPSKQGVKESALKALPKTRYEKAADIENQAVECAICLTEFEEGKWIRKLPQCGHEFHVRCIDKWLWSQPSCPSCRTEVVVPSPLSQETG